MDKTISLVSIREGLFRTFVPLKCRGGVFLHALRTYRPVFFRLNTTHNTDNRQPNIAAKKRAWLTPAEYSAAPLSSSSSSSSSTVISHGRMWQVYMLLYYCCGYLFFITPDRSSRSNTPLSLLLLRIVLCDPTLSLRQPCSTQTVRQQQQVACYAHVADLRCTLSTTASSGVCCCLRHIGLLCTYLLHAVCDRHFLPRTDHPRIVANHSYKASRTAAFVQTYSRFRSAVYPTLLTDPRASRKSTSTHFFVAVRVSYDVGSYHMAF